MMFLGLPMPMEFVPLDGLIAFGAINHLHVVHVAWGEFGKEGLTVTWRDCFLWDVDADRPAFFGSIRTG